MASPHRLQERSDAFQRAGLVIAIYSGLFIIRTIPYYNWYYTWLLIIALWISILSSPFVVATVLPPARSVAQWAANAVLYVALFAFIAGVFLVTAPLRGAFTQSIIEARYCDLSQPLPNEAILGGLDEITIGGRHQVRTGAFQDTSGCIGPSCVETFYYCPKARVHIGR